MSKLRKFEFFNYLKWSRIFNSSILRLPSTGSMRFRTDFFIIPDCIKIWKNSCIFAKALKRVFIIEIGLYFIYFLQI